VNSREVARPRRVSDMRIVLAWSGFADGPAQPLRDFLLERSPKGLVTVEHPLVPEGPHVHRLTVYKAGRRVRTRDWAAPVRPPFTYPLDLVLPPRTSAADLVIGFNALAVLRGLAGRRLRRNGLVVSWHVDFVPERFGASFATRVYDAADRFVCSHADARVELSEAARDGRNARHGLTDATSAPTAIVPMGSWTRQAPKTPIDGVRTRRVVYMGHLVERQGVATLVDAVEILRDSGRAVHVDIVGSGPELGPLTERAQRAGLDDLVTFHGFIEDHRDVADLLAGASVAVAPYVDDGRSFTRFADPGKLKAYTSAGLPTVLTPVPPNAKELELAGAATIVDDDPRAVAAGIEAWLADETRWRSGREAAIRYAEEIDWEFLFGEFLDFLGIES
jgi:glycosyltransferase involved in cell wall biosynthesis